ncbi:MAG: cytochrome P450 [Candidatus Omnitrophica bacterium]|nr:cytochrome P450 [Candidatus Omnitrophota bacterium]
MKYGWLYAAEGFNFLRLAKRLVREYGDLIHVQAGNRHHFYVSHPDLIEKVLLAGYKIRTSRPRPLRHALGRGLITSQGELHRTMRRLMQPIFQKHMVASKAALIVEETERAMAKWKDGETRDMAEEMTHLTLGVIVQILFGTECREKDRVKNIGKAMHLVHSYSHQNPASHINMRIEWIPWIGKFTGPARARKYLDDLIYGLIQKRRAEGNFEGQDLLSLLIKLQQTNPEIEDLHDKQIRDEILTMFLAGHETTANALAWTWRLLSEHPEVEKKLQNEVDRVLAGKPPAEEDIPNLPYTRMVFAESMRIYPPVWTLGRRPEDEGFELGGYVIPQKSMILLSPYLVHHDERFFPDPERFIPERFTAEEEAKRPKFAYFPFGGGHRRCFGENLAWTEGILVLATTAQKWQFRHAEENRVDLEPLISLKPRRGIRMIFQRRRSGPNTHPDLTNHHARAVQR